MGLEIGDYQLGVVEVDRFLQLTLHRVHTVHTIKSAVSLKWQVGFENDMKITPIFTIIFVSKILI